MGAHLVEPGAVLADRYVVEDLLAQDGASESWRSRDRVLARSVVIQVLPSSSPYAPQLLSAAKLASRVADTRILKVLDAIDDGKLSYIVREWATGQSLDIVLADGPLPARRATWLMREVAAAMANAHRLGLPHRRLSPDCVVLTKSSGVKLIGLGTSAALKGDPGDDDDPELEDTLDLGRLLYACLTARWPGGDISGLPAAPTEHGRLLRPRQVRAGVPRTLDGVCDRILGQHSRYGEPITTVAEVKDQLTRILAEEGFSTTTGVGLAAPPVATGSEPPEPPPALLHREGEGPPTGEQPAYPGHGSEGSSLGRGLIWSVVALLIAGAVLLAYLIGQQGTNNADPEPPRTSSGGSAPNTVATTPKPIAIVGATDFDPEGVDGENPDEVGLALDDDPSTAWETLFYNSAVLGSLKSGVGLILDLGEVQSVGAVNLTLQGAPTSVEIRATPPGVTTQPSSSVDEFPLVTSGENLGEDADFTFDEPVQTRYLLVWLTSLPPVDGEYRGRIANIEVMSG